jgi:hypothetical protein
VECRERIRGHQKQHKAGHIWALLRVELRYQAKPDESISSLAREHTSYRVKFLHPCSGSPSSFRPVFLFHHISNFGCLLSQEPEHASIISLPTLFLLDHLRTAPDQGTLWLNKVYGWRRLSSTCRLQRSSNMLAGRLSPRTMCPMSCRI